jgi:hypothetical protein
MAGTSFCPLCGAPTTPLDEICTNCGVQLAKAIEEKTWKPTVAGIMSIICGAGQVIGGIVFAAYFDWVAEFFGSSGMEWFGEWFMGLGIRMIVAPLIILGLIAIAGGIYALKRRVWGLALAGAICALPAGLILGILAIIFVISGKREFECVARMKKVPAENISPKLRLATTLLAFFLGIFGAHRFYVGKNETASVMLFFSILGLTILGLATILSLNGGWFFWGFSFIIALEIWAFVDFIFAVTGHMKDNEGRLIQKWRLVVPARKPEYYYIKYATSSLRIVGWIVLVLGIIGSLVWGITMGGIEGGIRIVLGIIGSFLAWLALLAARELLKLFMDVKGNTINTAERLTKEAN